jgi:hypothetical protein
MATAQDAAVLDTGCRSCRPPQTLPAMPGSPNGPSPNAAAAARFAQPARSGPGATRVARDRHDVGAPSQLSWSMFDTACRATPSFSRPGTGIGLSLWYLLGRHTGGGAGRGRGSALSNLCLNPFPHPHGGASLAKRAVARVGVGVGAIWVCTGLSPSPAGRLSERALLRPEQAR